MSTNSNDIQASGDDCEKFKRLLNVNGLDEWKEIVKEMPPNWNHCSKLESNGIETGTDKWIRLIPDEKPPDSKMVEQHLKLHSKTHKRCENVIGSKSPSNLPSVVVNIVDEYASDDDVIFV